MTHDDASPADRSLAALRHEIDGIDRALHTLLMERGELIDKLIAAKGRVGGGSAFRPAREAAMMRRLVERHRGLLPLDTVEGIWRIIISTFTYVQAPYAVHADVSGGDAASLAHAVSTSSCDRRHLAGALTVLRSRGRSVPHDLGLVTFDNDYAAQSSSPSLTTVEQPTVEQGRRMVDVLLHLIDGGSAPTVTMMPTRIIERGSE